MLSTPRENSPTAKAIPLVVILISTLLPACSIASSCIVEDQETAERSAKHESEVIFDVSKLGKEIIVSVEFPSKLDSEIFSRISLYSAVDGAYSVLAPLDSYDNGD
jgi:hypothetical protein